MRTVQTKAPSFPTAPTEAPLQIAPAESWQVLCGDTGHWRAGIYSPHKSSAAQVAELEWHDCPELFLLISGALTLVIADAGALREIRLPPGKPVLVTAPHTGFCPDGPHTGRAFVVERDAFTTEYRTPEQWLTLDDDRR